MLVTNRHPSHRSYEDRSPKVIAIAKAQPQSTVVLDTALLASLALGILSLMNLMNA
jgi:hypothetical protein